MPRTIPCIDRRAWVPIGDVFTLNVRSTYAYARMVGQGPHYASHLSVNNYWEHRR
jgi:hypothetical protein